MTGVAQVGETPPTPSLIQNPTISMSDPGHPIAIGCGPSEQVPTVELVSAHRLTPVRGKTICPLARLS